MFVDDEIAVPLLFAPRLHEKTSGEFVVSSAARTNLNDLWDHGIQIPLEHHLAMLRSHPVKKVSDRKVVRFKPSSFNQVNLIQKKNEMRKLGGNRRLRDRLPSSIIAAAISNKYDVSPDALFYKGLLSDNAVKIISATSKEDAELLVDGIRIRHARKLRTQLLRMKFSSTRYERDMIMEEPKANKATSKDNMTINIEVMSPEEEAAEQFDHDTPVSARAKAISVSEATARFNAVRASLLKAELG